MAEIKNSDMVKSVLGRWYPGDLAFIERLEYSADRKRTYSTLKLVGLFQRRDTTRGWPSNESEFHRIHLLFGGVSGLFIKDFGTIPKQITGFDIVDISDRKWEIAKFEIEDYERGQIGFFCNSVEVLSIKKVK
ncbi:MAG: hypothetical protein SXV54_13195 [Chloroflexota bacterium]|nr:hypothetical protein [Chloroflexota bacterium]